MTRAPLPRFLKNERGATAIEFALVIGFLLAFLMGAFEFGRALHARNALDYLADRAARSLSVEYRVSDMGLAAIEAALLNDARANAPGLRPELLGLTLRQEGTSFRIETLYDFTFLIPVIPVAPMTLTAERLIPAP